MGSVTLLGAGVPPSFPKVRSALWEAEGREKLQGDAWRFLGGAGQVVAPKGLVCYVPKKNTKPGGCVWGPGKKLFSPPPARPQGSLGVPMVLSRASKLLLAEDAGALVVGGSADIEFTNLTQFLAALQDVDLLGGGPLACLPSCCFCPRFCGAIGNEVTEL